MGTCRNDSAKGLAGEKQRAISVSKYSKWDFPLTDILTITMSKPGARLLHTSFYDQRQRGMVAAFVAFGAFLTCRRSNQKPPWP